MKRKRASSARSRRSTGPEEADRARIPSGKTITEYLSQRGLERGVELESRAPLKEASVLRIAGGRKYEIRRVIAEGGMGVIYEARDLNFRRRVALKILPKDPKYPSEDLLRFIEEAQVTSQLEHPNIVPVHEMGLDENGNVFYTMKYVRGQTLTDILLGLRERKPHIVEQYPLARLLTIFQKVCDAVAFAHSRKVVHRDLKPDNVMIGDYGEVSVMDWGLAKVLTPDGARADALGQELSGRAAGGEATAKDTSPGTHVRTDRADTGLKTMTGRVMGSPGFMAPEQIRNGGVAADTRSDIYSLGGILYSMLTLRPSVARGEVKEVLAKILAGDFPPPAAFNEAPQEGTRDAALRFPHCPGGQIPEALSDIAMKAMAADPAERYAAVGDLQQEIEAFQTGMIRHLVVDEDFSSEDFLSRWEILGGEYEWREGELRLSGGEPQLVVLKQDLPGDVRIEFDARFESVYLNDLGCFMSAVRSANYKEIPSSGYEFKYGAHDNSMNVLMRASQTLWGRPASPLARQTRYHVVAERVANRLRMVVNDVEVFDVVDPDPLAGADRVVAGLLGWMADARFTRIKVFALGTPWKSDILDVAERQIGKGRYDLAVGLFNEVLESFPDAERRERAQRGLATAREREQLARQLALWQKKLEEAWPSSKVQLRMDNDGLALEMTDAGVSDLEPVRGLPLTSLYCAFNRIGSLEPLRGMRLKTLNCCGNPLESLEPLRGMPLTTLVCESCRIRDLEPLRGMPLNMLICGVNEIESLEPLRGMPLTALGCWANLIGDLSPLAGMPLISLNVAGNRVESLKPLGGLSLSTLHCGGNRIETLRYVTEMPLSVLHCGDNLITDLRPLRGLSLTILSCHSNRIAALDPIEALPLGAITCGGNQLTGLSRFAQHPPDDFLFDCDTISTSELEWLHKKWSSDFRRSAHARNVAVLLAIRKNDGDALRGLASEFKGHRYLFVPKFMKWEEAKAFCEKLGGHLVTITSREENAFIESMFAGGCWFWMGLRTSEDGQAWVTGEPFSYNNFVDTMQEKKLGPKIFCRKWFSDHVPDSHNCFMIEWDG